MNKMLRPDSLINPMLKMTPRERQVLDLVMQGHSNKSAGRVLGISPRTVEVHRARVMGKFGVTGSFNLYAATNYWMQHGVDPTPIALVPRMLGLETLGDPAI
jgi:DNA-binding CsgD family transcriptional regulator